MESIEKIKTYQKMTIQKLEQILNQKDKINNLSISDINLLFLNVNNECKMKMLDNIDLFEKILNIPPNRMKKTVLDLVNDDIKEYIYNHKNLLKMKNQLTTLQIHLQKLSKEKFSQLLDNENLNKAFSLNTLEIINEKFNLTPYEYCIIKQEVISNRFSPIALLSINNKEELFIYAKFHILVNITNKKDNILILNEKEISYNFIKEVNKKHINTLLEETLKYNENISNNDRLITILKMYMVFGLDNSKKILNNFFTYATDSSLKRASEELFKDRRRAYRLQNQDKYYYYGMEENVEKALLNNDITYFKILCDRDTQSMENFMQKVKFCTEIEDETLKKEGLTTIIQEEINKRESYYHDLNTQKYIYHFKSIAREKDITLSELYQVFSNINCKYNMTKDGKIIPNETLTKVILGNCKKDNDCILRMIFNKEAFGLNNELWQIINHFEEIEEITNNNTNLSIYSILDIIDISKSFLYNLKPDELDITLETLSKILNSRKYCTEPPEIILERIMNLHKERKFKIACAVPLIKGEYKETKYQVVPPYEESLLVSGIDTESCFKVGGKGEDFFHYCLTSPLGFVLKITYHQNDYILPCTVNGNMININSIDPKITDEITYNHLMEVIKEIGNILINKTNNIELVTITDIHHETFTKNSNLPKINIDKFIPLNTDVYCDYNKQEVTNYIVTCKNNKTEPKYFNNEERFLLERFKPYIISPSHEYDKERINLLLNQIAYSSISFENIDELEKKVKKELFKELNVEDFSYIIGNMDWFIGIKKDNDIVEYVLPFDKRGSEEYRKYKGIIYQMILNTKYNSLKRKNKV